MGEEIGDALRRLVMSSVKNMITFKIIADDYNQEFALAA